MRHDADAFARFDALEAAGLEAAADLRPGFVDLAQLVVLQEGASLQKGEWKHLVCFILSREVWLDPARLGSDARFPLGILGAGKDGEAAAARAALCAIKCFESFHLLGHPLDAELSVRW